MYVKNNIVFKDKKKIEQQSSRTYFFEISEQVRAWRATLHVVLDDGFSQWLWASWLTDNKERYTKLDTDNDHEDILAKRFVLGNILFNLQIVHKFSLVAK